MSYLYSYTDTLLCIELLRNYCSYLLDLSSTEMLMYKNILEKLSEGQRWIVDSSYFKIKLCHKTYEYTNCK